MAVLTAVLNSYGFVEGVEKMAEATLYLFQKLDDSYRAMQKFEATILTFSGSTGRASDDLGTLLENSNRLGVSFEAAVVPFAKFASAAEGLSRNKIFDIFNSFNTALSAVRANGSEVNGVFLALQQIVSKGKLSMEELRLQLAERIPGAMKLAAQAAGMNMQEFEKAVQKGAINTNQWLVEFANLIEDKFSASAAVAAQSFDAAVTRMKNSLLFFNAEIVSGSGAGTVWAEIINDITDTLFNNQSVFDSSSIIVKNFSDIVLNLANVVLPAVPKGMELMSGATSLLSRAVGGFSTTVNGLYIVLSGLTTKYYEAKLAAYEFFNVFDVNQVKILEMEQKIINSKLSTMEFVENARDGLQTLTTPFDEIVKKTQELNDETQKNTTVFDERLKTLQEYSDKLTSSIDAELKQKKKSADDESKVINDMYKTAGFGADAYYNQEAEKLVNQVAKWQQYGADVNQSNEWLYDQLGKLSEEAWSKGLESAGQSLDSYQAMYTTLVDQFQAQHRGMLDSLEAVGVKADELDGKNIGLTASLENGLVISGLDEIINKIYELRNVNQQIGSMSSSAYSSYSAESGVDFSTWNAERNAALEGSSTSSSGTTIVNNFNQSLSKNEITDVTIGQIRDDTKL